MSGRSPNHWARPAILVESYSPLFTIFGLLGYPSSSLGRSSNHRTEFLLSIGSGKSKHRWRSEVMDKSLPTLPWRCMATQLYLVACIPSGHDTIIEP